MNLFAVVKYDDKKRPGVLGVFEFNTLLERDKALRAAEKCRNGWQHFFGNVIIQIKETNIKHGRCNPVINDGRFSVKEAA